MPQNDSGSAAFIAFALVNFSQPPITLTVHAAGLPMGDAQGSAR
jgi:hypothetical protein